MSRNNTHYEGRLINAQQDPNDPSKRVVGKTVLKKSANGNGVLELLIAEQFQEKKKNAAQKFKDANPAKTDDDWINTETCWHRTTLIGKLDVGSPLYELVTNPDFNHGAILEISAAYTAQGYTRRKDGVEVQAIKETIFMDSETKNDGYDTWLEIKVSPKSNTLLGASDGFQIAFWDGQAELPAAGGGGGGQPAAPDYGDNVGF